MGKPRRLYELRETGEVQHVLTDLCDPDEFIVFVEKAAYDKAIKALTIIMQEYGEDPYDINYNPMENVAYKFSMKTLTELGEL